MVRKSFGIESAVEDSAFHRSVPMPRVSIQKLKLKPAPRCLRMLEEEDLPDAYTFFAVFAVSTEGQNAVHRRTTVTLAVHHS